MIAAPTAAETWRVADGGQGAVAHLVIWQQAGVTAMACNWVPSRDGRHIDRAEMLRCCRWVCTRCASPARRQPLRRAS